VSSNPTFVAFDVETTGLFPGVDRIVELGAVHFQGDFVVDTWACLVDPGIPIPPAASRVHGITDADVRGKTPIGEALPGFLSFLSRGTPVAHNAEFDVGFLYTELAAGGFTGPEDPVLDTRGLARRAFPGRISYSLANLLKDYGLEAENAHRALADAYSCRRLFLLCAGVLGREKPLEVQDLACLSGAPLDFRQKAPRCARTAALLDRALRNGDSVRIAYRSSEGKITHRTIRPLSFTIVGGTVGINAFCMLRNQRRTFRLHAISDVRADDECRGVPPSGGTGTASSPSAYPRTPVPRPPECRGVPRPQ
jgi:DNA polymerase-3 subunit epsilon